MGWGACVRLFLRGACGRNSMVPRPAFLPWLRLHPCCRSLLPGCSGVWGEGRSGTWPDLGGGGGKQHWYHLPCPGSELGAPQAAALAPWAYAECLGAVPTPGSGTRLPCLPPPQGASQLSAPGKLWKPEPLGCSLGPPHPESESRGIYQ